MKKKQPKPPNGSYQCENCNEFIDEVNNEVSGNYSSHLIDGKWYSAPGTCDLSYEIVYVACPKCGEEISWDGEDHSLDGSLLSLEERAAKEKLRIRIYGENG